MSLLRRPLFLGYSSYLISCKEVWSPVISHTNHYVTNFHSLSDDSNVASKNG